MHSPRLAPFCFPRVPPPSRKINPSFNYFLTNMRHHPLPSPPQTCTATVSPGNRQTNKVEPWYFWKILSLSRKMRTGFSAKDFFLPPPYPPTPLVIKYVHMDLE